MILSFPDDQKQINSSGFHMQKIYVYCKSRFFYVFVHFAQLRSQSVVERGLLEN